MLCVYVILTTTFQAFLNDYQFQLIFMFTTTFTFGRLAILMFDGYCYQRYASK